MRFWLKILYLCIFKPHVGCNWQIQIFLSSCWVRWVQRDLGLLRGTCMAFTVKPTSRSGGCVQTWGLSLALSQRERETVWFSSKATTEKKKKKPAGSDLLGACVSVYFYTALCKLNCINSKMLRCAHSKTEVCLTSLIEQNITSYAVCENKIRHLKG